MDDRAGAFCRHSDVRIDGAADGSLAPLTFAAKDLFGVAGDTCCCGNPDWLRTHEPATQTASAISKLVDAGASLVGKTISDELAYSIVGRNVHYGTPQNALAHDRMPGGSSSGSAAAVAAGHADIGLGTDTGGSIRVPAACCGLFGIRTTHGAVPIDEVFPLAPSFDTVGWLARDAVTLGKVAETLLPLHTDTAGAPKLLVADDVLALCDLPIVHALNRLVLDVGSVLGLERVEQLGPEPLPALSDCFRILQGREIWDGHGDWIRAVQPRFDPEIGARIESLPDITDQQVEEAQQLRASCREAVCRHLDEGFVLVLPTTPTTAPHRHASDEELRDFRSRTMQLTCIASLCGCPQVSIPAGVVEGAPIGLSLVGPPGSDAHLLALAGLVDEALRRNG